MHAKSQYERLRIRVDEMESERKLMDNTRQEIADNLLGRRDFVTGRRMHEYDRAGHYVKGKPYSRRRRTHRRRR